MAIPKIAMKASIVLSNILAGLLGFAAASAAAEPVRLLGFDTPPMSVVTDGKKLSGPGYDFVADLFKAAEVPFVSEGLPIIRAVSILDEGNAVMVFLARTPAREDKYVWLGDIVPDDGLAFTTRVGDAPITSVDQAKGLKTVAVLAGGAPAQILRGNGVTGLDETANESQNLRKLAAGRVDAWFTSAIITRHILKADPEQAKSVSTGPKVMPWPLWIVGSKNLAPEVVAKLQQAFATAKSNGRYAAFRAQID